MWLQLLDKALSRKKNKVRRTQVVSFLWLCNVVLYKKYDGNGSRNKGCTMNLCATVAVHGTIVPQVLTLVGYANTFVVGGVGGGRGGYDAFVAAAFVVALVQNNVARTSRPWLSSVGGLTVAIVVVAAAAVVGCAVAVGAAVGGGGFVAVMVVVVGGGEVDVGGGVVVDFVGGGSAHFPIQKNPTLLLVDEEVACSHPPMLHQSHHPSPSHPRCCSWCCSCCCCSCSCCCCSRWSWPSFFEFHQSPIELSCFLPGAKYDCYHSLRCC